MNEQGIEKTPHCIDCTDLTSIPRYQYLIELFLPLPWFVLSLLLYNDTYWALGFVCSFMFFLCCLRLNHEAIHSNLRIPRNWDHVIMHVLSPLMLGSNHADAYCHLQHHRDMLGPEDHEGHCSNMTLKQVLLYGPRFPLDLNLATWRSGLMQWRKRMLIDWVCVSIFASTCLLSGHTFLWLHLCAMVAGQCLSAFFAVWSTHQGTAHSGLAGRSQRGICNKIAYHMFYHREHHLYPQVPVSRLPELAKRLDQKVPGYAESRIPVTSFFDGH